MKFKLEQFADEAGEPAGQSCGNLAPPSLHTPSPPVSGARTGSTPGSANPAPVASDLEGLIRRILREELTSSLAAAGKADGFVEPELMRSVQPSVAERIDNLEEKRHHRVADLSPFEFGRGVALSDYLNQFERTWALEAACCRDDGELSRAENHHTEVESLLNILFAKMPPELQPAVTNHVVSNSVVYDFDGALDSLRSLWHLAPTGYQFNERYQSPHAVDADAIRIYSALMRVSFDPDAEMLDSYMLRGYALADAYCKRTGLQGADRAMFSATALAFALLRGLPELLRRRVEDAAPASFAELQNAIGREYTELVHEGQLRAPFGGPSCEFGENGSGGAAVAVDSAAVRQGEENVPGADHGGKPVPKLEQERVNQEKPTETNRRRQQPLCRETGSRSRDARTNSADAEEAAMEAPENKKRKRNWKPPASAALENPSEIKCKYRPVCRRPNCPYNHDKVQQESPAEAGDEGAKEGRRRENSTRRQAKPPRDAEKSVATRPPKKRPRRDSHHVDGSRAPPARMADISWAERPCSVDNHYGHTNGKCRQQASLRGWAPPPASLAETPRDSGGHSTRMSDQSEAYAQHRRGADSGRNPSRRR